MNAKTAYNLAKQKGDVTPYLAKIEAAAMNGALEVSLDHLLNEFQQAALFKLGYMVEPNYDGFIAVSSRSKASSHKIVWRYAGEEKKAPTISDLLAGRLNPDV